VVYLVVCVCKSVVRVFWGFTPFLFLIQKYADLLRIQENNECTLLTPPDAHKFLQQRD
jgi:hypothetical protein